MKEKTEIKLFENDYTLTGKHATHLKYLVKEAQIYEDYIDVYLNAVVFGYLNNVKDIKDNESSDRARIYADAFSNHRYDCVFLYRLIILLDDKDISIEERLNRAFRYDAEENKYEQVQENIDIFNSYVLGGIEEMYKLFVDGCSSKDDYIKRTFDITKRFKDDIDGVSYEDKIKKLLGK